MMTGVDSLRSRTVYFPSEYAANEVAVRLRPVVPVEGPERVKPYMGRAFAVVITLPASLSPMDQFGDSHIGSLIDRMVMEYDGVASKPGGES